MVISSAAPAADARHLDAQQVRGPGQQGRVAHRLGRGDEQEPARLRRQRRHAVEEVLLGPAGQGPRVGASEPARQFHRGQPAGQFQQGARVSPRLGDDAVTDETVEAARDHGVQQGACVAVTQRSHHQVGKLRQPGRDGGLPHREHQPDPLGPQAPRDEGERL
ncbi:hypothetical protein [Streptomyces sp. PU_AKi4]|uniref:hypothetical protein n=1 Tax=Streptomyces sp. PU_AKi4 TaxID=2800809 RepID=UPI003523134A